MIHPAIIAQQRFGVGLAPGMDWERLGSSSFAKDYVSVQLDAEPEAFAIKGRPDSATTARTFIEFQSKQAKARKSGDVDAVKAIKLPDIYNVDVATHIHHAVNSETPLIERLCWFWSNHFCVAASKNQFVKLMAGPFEREAIRPYVLGSFRDMLHAVVRHPAMLQFLDNQTSVGPNSPFGKKKNKGLNENFAREIMELHSLGVNGGYSQDDVIAFAKALTGWSLTGSKAELPRSFHFFADRHEPGEVELLGRKYSQTGMGQTEAILDDLARHSSTASFISEKLARYFIGEAPPEDLVAALTQRFKETHGNLKELVLYLVNHPSSWEIKPAIYLSPIEMLVSSLRSASLDVDQGMILRYMRTFGQTLWDVPSPAGWPDENEAWASPDAIMERIDWLTKVVGPMVSNRNFDADAFAHDLLGGQIGETLQMSLQKSRNKTEKVVLLLLSPELQRR